jgi:drug/metabolite transporter (DMT)-like permease
MHSVSTSRNSRGRRWIFVGLLFLGVFIFLLSGNNHNLKMLSILPMLAAVFVFRSDKKRTVSNLSELPTALTGTRRLPVLGIAMALILVISFCVFLISGKVGYYSDLMLYGCVAQVFTFLGYLAYFFFFRK